MFAKKFLDSWFGFRVIPFTISKFVVFKIYLNEQYYLSNISKIDHWY